MTRSNGEDRVPEEDDLARLKSAAAIAEEAARWLRNNLDRLRAGHDVEFEIRSAEDAIQVALERVRGNASEQQGAVE